MPASAPPALRYARGRDERVLTLPSTRNAPQYNAKWAVVTGASSGAFEGESAASGAAAARLAAWPAPTRSQAYALGA